MIQSLGLILKLIFSSRKVRLIIAYAVATALAIAASKATEGCNSDDCKQLNAWIQNAEASARSDRQQQDAEQQERLE